MTLEGRTCTALRHSLQTYSEGFWGDSHVMFCFSPAGDSEPRYFFVAVQCWYGRNLSYRTVGLHSLVAYSYPRGSGGHHGPIAPSSAAVLPLSCSSSHDRDDGMMYVYEYQQYRTGREYLKYQVGTET